MADSNGFLIKGLAISTNGNGATLILRMDTGIGHTTVTHCYVIGTNGLGRGGRVGADDQTVGTGAIIHHRRRQARRDDKEQRRSQCMTDKARFARASG